MRGLPAGAVLRQDDAWVEVFERLNRWHNDRVESGSCQMESSDNGMDLTDARHLTSALQRVHHAGMATCGQNYQTFVLDVHNDRLVIVNPWIRLPLPVDQRQLIGTAFFKWRCAWNLACHQCSTADHHARSTFFDDFDVFRFEIPPARRKVFRLMPVGLNVLTFQVGGRMEHDRRSWPAVPLNKSQQTARVVRVAVAENYGV